MENIGNIIPLIVFFIIIAGVISRIKNAIEEAQRRTQDPNRTGQPTDLPEATRRQLYGDRETTVRRARPLVPGQPPEYDGEGVDDEDTEIFPPPAARPARPQPQPRPTGMDWGQVRRQVEEGARNLEAEARRGIERQLGGGGQRGLGRNLGDRVREAADQMRRQAEEATQRQAEARQAQRQTEYQRQEELRRRQREAQQGQRQPAGPTIRKPMQELRSPELAGGPVPPIGGRAPRVRTGAPRGHALFESGDDIRRAIVLREVLGPPRGLE